MRYVPVASIIGLRAVFREQPIRRSAELILKALTRSDARTASRCRRRQEHDAACRRALQNTKRLERQLERAQYLLAGAAAGCALISRARRMAVTKSSAVKVEISRRRRRPPGPHRELSRDVDVAIVIDGFGNHESRFARDATRRELKAARVSF